MTKINITSIILLIYLVVMSVIGWPGNKPEPNYLEYFGIIVITLGVICLLRYVQIKRFKIRNKKEN